MIQNRTATITNARKNPAPDRAANTGLTCELCCVVVNGTVDGVTGRFPPMDGRVVEVVDGGGSVDRGVVFTGRVWRTTGRVVGAAVAGGEVVGGVVRATVVGGIVVEHEKPTQVLSRVVEAAPGTAPAGAFGPASAKPSISDAAPAKRMVRAVRARRAQMCSIANSVAEPGH